MNLLITRKDSRITAPLMLLALKRIMEQAMEEELVRQTRRKPAPPRILEHEMAYEEPERWDGMS